MESRVKGETMNIKNTQKYIEEYSALSAKKDRVLSESILRKFKSEPNAALHCLEIFCNKKLSYKKMRTALLFFEQALCELRYQEEAGFSVAKEMIEAVQERLIHLYVDHKIESGKMPPILSVFNSSHVNIIPDLRNVVETLSDEEYANIDIKPSLPDMFNEMSESMDSSFELYQMMLEGFHQIQNEEAQSGMFLSMLFSSKELVKECAVLGLLHPEKTVRTFLVEQLLKTNLFKEISPLGLRRMITLRNWLPVDERTALDELIKLVRKSGLECAPPAGAVIVKLQATIFDGAGCQMIVALVKDQNEFIICGFLLKETVGIFDPWMTMGLGQKKAESTFKEIARTAFITTNTDYISKAAPEFLARNLINDKAVSAWFIAVSELLDLPPIQATKVDIRTSLNVLINEAFPEGLNEYHIKKSLKKSADLIKDLKITGSWFEVGEHLNECFYDTTEEPSISSVIDVALDPKRDIWANRFLWLSEMMKTSSNSPISLWKDFLVLSHLIEQGEPLSAIPLMCGIAEKTTAYHEYGGSALLGAT